MPEQPQPAATEPVASTVASPPAAPVPEEDGLILDELLVEDVSIDGMCGVY